VAAGSARAARLRFPHSEEAAALYANWWAAHFAPQYMDKNGTVSVDFAVRLCRRREKIK